MKTRGLPNSSTEIGKQSRTIQKLSVVVLSYNTKDTTLTCLKSLYEHAPTIAELETVVIDNASSDESAKAIERLFPQIKLIRNARNRGFAAACNQGIRSTGGDIVLLLNSDTELIDQSLDVMLDFIERNPEVGIAGGAMIGENGTPQATCQHFPNYGNILFAKQSLLSSIKTFKKNFNKYRGAPEAVTDVDAIAGGFMFIRREAMRKVGLLDERFFFYVEDLDLSKRMFQAGWRVVFVPQSKALHIGGKSTALKPTRCYWWHHESLYRYFTKHYRKYFLFNAILGVGLTGHFALWWLFRKLGLTKNGSN